MTTPPDEPRQFYVRDSPEYRAAWLQVLAERRLREYVAQRLTASRGRRTVTTPPHARRSARVLDDRESPAYQAALFRVFAERRQRAREANKRRLTAQKAQQATAPADGAP